MSVRSPATPTAYQRPRGGRFPRSQVVRAGRAESWTGLSTQSGSNPPGTRTASPHRLHLAVIPALLSFTVYGCEQEGQLKAITKTTSLEDVRGREDGATTTIVAPPPCDYMLWRRWPAWGELADREQGRPPAKVRCSRPHQAGRSALDPGGAGSQGWHPPDVFESSRTWQADPHYRSPSASGEGVQDEHDRHRGGTRRAESAD